MSRCIFCSKHTSGEPEEHIVPESLLGDITFDSSSRSGIVVPARRLVLSSDEVCQACNSKALSPLDQYLQDQLGFLKVIWNVKGTKKGAPAAMRRPGANAVRTPEGIHLDLNTESHAVVGKDGAVVKPADNRGSSVLAAQPVRDGDTMLHRFTQPMHVNKRFIRALHKIAFELLCFQQGATYVLHPRFDWLREYVLHAKGSRIIAMTGSAESVKMPPPVRLLLEGVPDSDDWMADILLGISFVLDLTADNRISRRCDVDQLVQGGLILWSDANGGRRYRPAG
jgi:hypothetical protein